MKTRDRGEEEGKDLRDRMGNCWHEVLDEMNGSQYNWASKLDKIVLQHVHWCYLLYIAGLGITDELAKRTEIADDATKTHTPTNESKQDAFPPTNCCTKSSQMLFVWRSRIFGTFPVD